MRILWLTINSSYSHSSLALPLIHAAAAGVTGWEWCHLQASLKDDIAALAVKAASMQPDLIAAPLYIFNREAVLNLLARIRQLLPGCVICVGGPECLGEGAAETMAQAPWLNFALRGEGESIFPELLRKFPETAGVPGVVTRENDGGTAPVYAGWASAPPPPLDEFYSFDRPFVQIESSRGCPNRCAFCTSGGTPIRFRPVDAVLEEIALVRQRGIREIRMLDRTFNLPDGRAAQLLHAFRTRFDDMRFHLEVHPASLGPSFREEIRNAVPGQLHLEAGVQTLEPEALRLMDRDFDTAKTLDGLEFLCGVSAVAVHTDIIAGCPGQTAAGIFRDLRRLMALRPAELQMEIMKMLHGTPLRRRARECGIRFSPLSPYDVIATPSLSAEDILRMRLLSRMVDCWYNSPELQAPFAAMVESSEGFLEEFLNFAALKYAFDAGPAPALRHRFLWLHEYMEANSATEAAREALALQWLRCAFPAGEGPAAKAENSRGIPAEAEFISGTPCTGRSGIRSVRVPLAAGGCIYLAYDRGIAPNRATAEYML